MCMIGSNLSHFNSEKFVDFLYLLLKLDRKKSDILHCGKGFSFLASLFSDNRIDAVRASMEVII